MTEQYPIFISLRDRLEPLQTLLNWLDRVNQREIWLIDNDSTYPPLVEFLSTTEHRVVRSGRNWGSRAPWLTGTIQRVARNRYFVVTDPDVVPDDECPLDALDYFRSILDRHLDLHKAGFGLRIDDLPERYALAADVVAWETQFWERPIEPGLYAAPIDTTFALYRPMRRHSDSPAVRTGAPYLARHLPWYVDSSNLSEEDRYYRERADPFMSNWNGDQPPLWKQRWLERHRPDHAKPKLTDGDTK
ncbi:MAG: glycosyltransferase family 2 protein [Actinomycetia bacterium]|nr:glycosyltransferase family 2 protein [Actinomycetes bacterium]